MRGTCVNLAEKEVRTCTRVLLYISDDDDVDAKILFTEMIRFIIVTYEQFNREKIMSNNSKGNKDVRKELVNILHLHGVSLQFNCFHGVFEIVEQDMGLDIVLSEARDRRGKFDKIQPKG